MVKSNMMQAHKPIWNLSDAVKKLNRKWTKSKVNSVKTMQLLIMTTVAPTVCDVWPNIIEMAPSSHIMYIPIEQTRTS